MKKLILFLGAIILLPAFMAGQDTSYLSLKDFQLEKKRLLESIYLAKKTNQELRDKLLFQAASLDSLVQLQALQAKEMVAHHDSLTRLQSYQSDLDGRLITQRKSGTLIAILIPACLFLLFLLLLIWLIIFRHRMLSMFNHLDDRLNEQSKQFDDQLNHYKREHDTIRAELRTSEKEADNRVQKLSGEIEEKLKNLDKLMQEEKASHDSRHQESYKTFEEFKGGIQSGYASITKDLAKLKEELAVTAKDFTARIKELSKKKSE